MTRNLFYACVLMSGAALATGWALAPGCEGSFCLGASFKTEAERDRARVSELPDAGRVLLGETVRESAPAAAPGAWLPGEDTQISWGEAAPRGESEVEEPAEGAFAPESEITPEVWWATPKQRAAHDEPLIEAFDDGGKPELSTREKRRRAVVAAKAARQWASLAEAALGEPDDEKRGEAINGVALHRSADAVAVLNEVAAFDPSPDNRLQAVQQLWYSAADGLDGDGGIRSTLQAALDDPDDDIAAMAEKALADLRALEEAQDYN